MARIEIRFAGFGGQGIATLGRIFGEAVSLFEEGKNAVMTQNYGPESRGGASSTDVVIDEEEIAYPRASMLDYFVVMSEEAYHTYIHQLKDGGIIFAEKDLVKIDKKAEKAQRIYRIPATKIAESLGNTIYANIVMLGFIASNVDLVSEEALIRVIKEKLNPKYVAKNLEAFKKGKQYKEEG